MIQLPEAFWSIPTQELLTRLGTSPAGLSGEEAARRLARQGPSLLARRKRPSALGLLLAQFASPIILMLLFAGGLSFFLGSHVDAVIIGIIVVVSGLLGFWQERNASHAVERLLATVQVKAMVLRDARPLEIPVYEVVPGDVVELNAGDVIPGDAAILECKDLFLHEAALTGETYPVEKSAEVMPADAPLSGRSNVLFMGTHVVSGTAHAVVVRAGAETEFGRVSARLRLRAPETEFERGIRRFGQLLLATTLLLVIAAFAINVYLARPVLESFLFALALAVGLTPQLLPAIISINLAHGARRMAHEKVIVKRLAAIENFGSMDVLCADKTGTLTEGTVRVHSALDAQGQPSERALLYAYLNAYYQTGFTNPIDEAICAQPPVDLAGYEKLDEVPYDFLRKRISILVAHDGRRWMVTKGALPEVLAVCTMVETASGTAADMTALRSSLQQRFEDLSRQGYRVLGVAAREVQATRITHDLETEMTFVGFLVLFDPPKPEMVETLRDLRRLGVSLKMVTGDNRFVAASVGESVGLGTGAVLSGDELRRMSDEALIRRVGAVDVFAEIEPNQKERVILALKKAGHVVGYMGDGINDASALHAADVSISVDGAVDVAKEAAEIVLLEKDLGVLARGVEEGRTTFSNTLKYVFMATSANFGNMFSMAGASLFLPFLPLLPTQILLTNLLTDLPEMAIAADSVDRELVERPRRWDIGFIRRFMVTFGLVSSVFDFLTFGVLLLGLHAATREFRTGWFVESVISAATVVLVIRSRRPFFRSRPARPLLAATVAVAVITVALPFTPLGAVFGFLPLPAVFLAAMAALVAVYVITAEVVKKVFYRRP